MQLAQLSCILNFVYYRHVRHVVSNSHLGTCQVASTSRCDEMVIKNVWSATFFW